ncbi:hypothetical protein [Streptomyces sp. NPDC048191]|uniref:hypothetical protein n=1 Tax=Streptomyces sp. NPDC048191 TaxID=3155484 RepID=UPI0033E9CE51
MSTAAPCRVFLGAPSVLTAEQEPELERWVAWIEQQGSEVVRLSRDAYGEDPWRALTRLLREVDGVVLLGFRQLDARNAVWRPDTKEEDASAGWWTTPWLHIEAGMAVALGLPLLVAPETDVEDGVFHPDVWGTQVSGTELSPPGTGADDWLNAVRAHRDHRAGTSRDQR